VAPSLSSADTWTGFAGLLEVDVLVAGCVDGDVDATLEPVVGAELGVGGVTVTVRGGPLLEVHAATVSAAEAAASNPSVRVTPARTCLMRSC
jgi:hypothetical protein